MVTVEKLLEVSKTAAAEAGEMIRYSRPESVRIKSYSDYVTEVDIECQNIIKKNINREFPGHVFMAEEDGDVFDPEGEMWIIDPLDGTTNFIHDLRHSAVSIAYCRSGEILTGVIFDPFKDELFFASKGSGAFLNGKRIKVSAKNDLRSGLIATGMPFKRHEKIECYFKCLSEMLANTSGIRRMGSAALDMAYTACGRFDGFFEGWLSAWDIAAGILIVEESGGKVCDFSGGKDVLSNGCVVAGAPGIFSDLFSIVNKNLKEKM